MPGEAQKRQRTVEPIVAGLFSDVRRAGEAVTDLKSAGFRAEEIGLAMQGEAPPVAHPSDQELRSKAPEDATSGAVGGGLLGGMAGLLAGLGVVAVPGAGLLAGGALASLLGPAGAGAAAGAGVGAAAGGLVGGLVGLNIPDAEAQYLEEGVQAGRVLLTVSAGGRPHQVRTILERHGADLGGGRHGDTESGDIPLV